MTITARFPGHTACPAVQRTQATASKPQAAAAETGIIKSFSRRYKDAGPVPGDTFRSVDGRVLTVVSVRSRYISRNECEDQDDFTFGGDPYYVFNASCRMATPEEAAPVVEREEKAQAEKQAQTRVTEIKRQIQDTGERPEGPVILRGDELMSTRSIYGGGDWFQIDSTHIWYVRNNGADGDNWSNNNIQTGGAGAIGWRIPLDEALATELRTLAETLKGVKL